MTGTATRTRRVGADRTDLLEALITGAGPHLEPLLDVGGAANGDLLLVVPESAARLPELLLGPAITTAGEAVTVLAPLAAALQRLHGCGVALDGADGSAVVLDGTGSPAWSPDRVVLSRRAGPAAFSAAVDADLAAFGALADGLLARCGCTLRILGRPLELAVEDLFDAADPLPVRLQAEVGASWSGLPGRLVAAAQAGPEPVPPARWRSALAPLAAVRRRMWVALGTAAALLVAALVLLPAGRPAVDASGVRQAPAPVTSATPASVARRGTEPRRAVRLLLEARARCLAAGDTACLDGVSGAGSPVRRADLSAMEAGTEAPLPSPTSIRLVSEGGGTVIAKAGRDVVVAVEEPDGWRLRDVVAEPPR